MSDLRVDEISAANGANPVTLTKQHAPKLFLGATDAAVIVDSLNVSSSVAGGTGDYDYNIINAFSYGIDDGCGIGGCASGGARAVRLAGTPTTTNFINIQTETLSDGANANSKHHLIVCGVLA